ncbi:cytochrome c oxidase subunit 3 [Hugenholtzia roseola]|uniref:cytochrome c oxidase subunit 3 n=1 Tax=Hugenholtzia roseola TaxID=1002 RepID=UPI0004298F66|nr:cytochrome c oxidase subunit 3 [Hugenholtzia roseola]
MQRQEKDLELHEQNLLRRVERQHPYLIMLYLGIASIVTIFSFLLLLLAISPLPEESVKAEFSRYPWQFAASSFFILLSSFAIEKARQSFFRDNFEKMAIYLNITNILGGIFALFQVMGWLHLYQTGTQLSGHASGAYLYIISGLHLAHLLAGVLYLAYYAFQIYSKGKDSVQVLIAVTNPYEHLKLKMVRTYWHFMGILWVVLAALLYILI